MHPASPEGPESPASPAGTSRPRALVPDLARGVMLLVIALAHAQVLSAGAGGALGRAVAAFHTIFIDSRGYPMFAALFGYGVVQILARRGLGAEERAARRLTRRRGGWMVVFGFFHSLLLFHGDILAAYGLLSLGLLAALRSPDGRLLVHAAVGSVAGALAFGVAALFIPDGSEAVSDPWLSAGYRVVGWIVSTPLFAVMAAGPFLLGIWAARRRLLERPERHAALLRRTAVLGIAAAAVGALPLAALTAELWPDGSAVARSAATALHTLTGYAGGLGYAALIAVLATRIGEGRGVLVTALLACGERSLTCYLAQSLAWQLLFEPYLAGLGRALTPQAAAAIGLGVWALTVVLADALRRTGRPGPAEALLRRLTYGPRPAGQRAHGARAHHDSGMHA
ncbi:DUF418 domain-containing protein [Sorangium sp. So ce315]|uniref:DUF418 domain-containing protein n=1 Tax=Sorangium sp. So ce315 TaxID=3133299 RepID=UPI003F62642A